MRQVKVENKIKINDMLMRYKNAVELEIDSIAAVSAYLLSLGFEKNGGFEGVYTFAYYFVRDNNRYCLYGNWFKGELVFRKEAE